jgi:hypothetical protein
MLLKLLLLLLLPQLGKTRMTRWCDKRYMMN